MERNERVWITAWAALGGLSLLILHNWVETLSKSGTYFGVIWPLYVLAVTLPLSLQMLSRYRNEKLLWLLSAGFSSVMAGGASYIGHNAWVEDIPNHYYHGLSFMLAIGVFTCWFILTPFAEHKLFRRSWCDNYTLLFSATWNNTTKLLSAVAFIGLFWGLLFLWAGLFKVLKVTFFYELFTGRNFVYPVTAVAFGIGLSLYSAKEDVLVGLYRTSLNVLGWLLPLVTFIMLLFLLTLLFQGLDPLWKTGYATALMLTLLGLMVFLFNAAWQDASGAQKFPKWLVNIISLGFVVMPLYIVLCTYSLGLRVSQHGWSIDRIWAALAVFVLSIYAFGYAATSIRRQTNWMAGAKGVNIAGGLIIVTLLTLTATPVLDPARISVNSQIDRLLSNKASVDKFDFNYLRFNAGQYGNAQLRKLLDNTNHPEAELLHAKVESTLKKKYVSYGQEARSVEWSHDKLAGKLKLYPSSVELDPAFVDFLLEMLKASKFNLYCGADSNSCELLSIDLNADAVEELVLFNAYNSKVFGLENGKWGVIGNLSGNLSKLSGPSLIQSLEEQNVETLPRKWSDIRLGNDQYSVIGIQK